LTDIGRVVGEGAGEVGIRGVRVANAAGYDHFSR
jgi:hypothetical protein